MKIGILSATLKRLRRTGRDERGATVIEFALVLPLLLALVGGIFEGGLLMYTWGQVEYINRQAARSVAIGQYTSEQAYDFIVAQMASSIGSPTVVPVIDPADDGSEVVVTVTLPPAALIDITPFGIFRTVTLTSSVTMLCEVSC